MITINLILQVTFYSGCPKKLRQRLVCPTERQTDHCTRRNPVRKRTVWVVERRSLRTNGCHNLFRFVLVSQYSRYATLQPSADFDRNVRNHLNVSYPNRQVSRGEPVPWLPDPTPLDYFLWVSMKIMVYGTPVTSEEDLIARVHGAIESLTRQLHLMGQVREAQHHRCRRL